MLPYSHTPILPYSHTPILPYSHTPFLLLFFLNVLGMMISGISSIGHAATEINPSLHWQVLTTSHFLVYYHQGLEPLAKRASEIAEKVHGDLSRVIPTRIKERTHLILIDDRDVSDPEFSYLPYNALILRVSRSGSWEQLKDTYTNWLTQEITHAYTRILVLGTRGGIVRYMQYLTFGFLEHSAVQPQWMIEGFPLFMERHLIDPEKRTLNTYAEMILRMDVLEDHFIPIDQANHTITRWPRRNIPAVYGNAFYEYLEARYGLDKVVPFACLRGKSFNLLKLDREAKKRFGTSLTQLWEDWHTSLREKYQARQQELQARGLTISQPLTATGDHKTHLHYKPDGKQVLYERINPDRGIEFRRLNLEDLHEEVLWTSRYEESAAWAPDRNTLAISRPEIYRKFNLYYLLHTYDLTTGQRVIRPQFDERGNPLRLRDPDYAPDGTRLVAISNRSGYNNLAILSLKDGSYRVITHNSDFTRYEAPLWSPDGSWIAVNVWREGPKEIEIYTPEGEVSRPIPPMPANQIDPSWSPDGKYLLFASDLTGIYNLYAYDLRGSSLYRITNVLGGAFEPQVSPDGKTLLFLLYRSTGFDLHQISYDPSAWVSIPS